MKNDSVLKYGDLTEKIIAVFYEVYNELGHGFLESVYHRSFEYALSARGLMFGIRSRFLFGLEARRLVISRLTC